MFKEAGAKDIKIDTLITEISNNINEAFQEVTKKITASLQLAIEKDVLKFIEKLVYFIRGVDEGFNLAVKALMDIFKMEMNKISFNSSTKLFKLRERK